MKRRSFIQKTGIAGLGVVLSPLACAKTKALDTEFLILGGGLSGLYLAYLLEKEGRDYILLEGSNRVGGRMFTRKDINRDVGGKGIGDGYAEVMSLVQELHTEMIDITEYMNSPTAIYKDGQLHTTWDGPEPNPRMLQYRAFGKEKQLGSLDEWYKRPELDEAYSKVLKRNGLSETEIDLVNISANYNDVRETSAMNAYHSSAFRKYNTSKRILNFKGGTASFIESLVKKLEKPVLKNKMVVSIDDSGDSVSVTCEDGASYKSKKVISTMPFSTLRDVKMNASFNSKQEKAIQNLNYTKITQIHLTHSSPFWEEDGSPAAMWTDTPLERVMNLSSHKDEKQIACWVNGKGTAFFDKMSEKEVAEYTIKKMNEIRPASTGKIEYLGMQNWGKYKYNKGAYAEFGVGQAAWFEDMIKPASNIHFAGEHTAHMSRGMEAAAESAKRVFFELIN
ncbi:NAD(P)/FAD-dependent oxidoreductase [uncultured Maribacter sp.]|uniref:flavin monoamine oxidase family protein n=1 Tax=uncultured Maribacter sp. TaxID=431308 RepID=UPI002629FE7B|nr:NAD(P)/FAD-dependent oxidoreductase [uncultured Maribacter sp.]